MALFLAFSKVEKPAPTLLDVTYEEIFRPSGFKKLLIDPTVKAIDWLKLFNECAYEIAQEYRGFLGSFGTLIVGFEDLHKKVVVIQKHELFTPNSNLAMIEAASKVGLIALAQLGIAGIVWGIAVPQAVVLTISTVILLLSITAFIYRKMTVHSR